MNFSKKGMENKINNIKSVPIRLASKGRVTLFRIFIVFAVFTIIVGTYSGLGLAKGLIDSAPDISQISVLPQGYRTTMYDINGNAMQTLIGANSNRVYVSMDEIPLVVQQSFLAIEDERFYEHDGIDIRGIFRALFSGLSKGDFDQGASTITQQLLKNQVFDGGTESTFTKKLERKIQEQYLAIQLEDVLDKDMILEYYLNTINLSSGTYGVQTAARRYFNKDVGDLNLSESSVIAAITQSPVYRNPITYPESNASRRMDILNKMLELEWCTPEEYQEAIEDDVYTRILTVNDEIEDTNSYYSYFVDAAIEQILEDLQVINGYTQSQATQLLYSGGLEIFTTQDPAIQKICDEVYSDESFFPAMGISYWELTYALSIEKSDGSAIHYHGQDLLEFHKDFPDPEGLYVDDNGSKFSLLFLDKKDMKKRIKEFRKSVVEDGDEILGESISMIIQPQSSFVVMDQYEGNVVALIGGRGVKEGNRTLNRAYNTTRQPGSTFKVVSTFLPALDSAGKTLASVYDDAPYNYPGTERGVQNWRGTTNFAGLSPLRKAIWDSMNIVTVKTLEDVTPQLAYDYLLKLGFTTLVESRVEPNGSVVSDINYPLALGGLTDGVTNVELTASYAAIANSGRYNKPRLYTKILSQDGKVILDNTLQPEQVMKESTAWLLTSAMEDVVTLGTGRSYSLGSNMPVAGKTGSTTGFYDLWFSGYTPYYTSTIWTGFDNNRTLANRDYQKGIWRTIMDRIHKELKLDHKIFLIPDSIEQAKICTKSGKLAVDGLCDNAITGSHTKIEYFAKDNMPTEKCDIHVNANYCTIGKALASEFCPASHILERAFLIKSESYPTADKASILPTKICDVHRKAIPPEITPPVNEETSPDDLDEGQHQMKMSNSLFHIQ